MKKVVVISLIVLLFIIFAFISFSLFTKSIPSVPLFKIIPSPTPVLINGTTNKISLEIQKTDPNNEQIQVPINANLTMQLSKPITTLSAVDVWIYPEIPFSLQLNGKNITLKPNVSLAPGTTYTYAVKFSDGTISPSFSFSTQGEGPVSNPNTDISHDLTTSWNKHFRPDLYLANLLPRSTPSYYAAFSFTPPPLSGIYFRVTLKDANSITEQQDFLQWVESTGLTVEQIKKLDIRYQNPFREVDSK